LIEVVVSGANGRLGKRIVEQLSASSDLKLAGALVRGVDPGMIRAGTVLIEVATKDAALDHAARAAEVGAPMIIASTGFDAKERSTLEAFAAKAPVLIAPNLSLGVAVLVDLAERAAKALPGYHLEIVELHHAKKRDAPSGTAWAIARAAAKGRGQDAERDAILARAGEIGPRGEAEIGIQSVRGGDIVGEHTLYLVGPTERLELSHKAATRDVFAAGAIAAARFLAAQKPGLYTMRDVLGLSNG
jgi:4-hydroxy-tetrahydrodipicolinate reductase